MNCIKISDDDATCDICGELYSVDVLLQTSENEFYCKNCFRENFYNGGESSAKGADGDNTEESAESDASKTKKSNKIIPNPEKYMKRNDVTNSLYNLQNISLMSLSRRPLQCPKADCNKFISVCTLESHYIYEHKEVPIVSTNLEARCSSEFYPRDIRYCTTECIVLLKISDDDLFHLGPMNHQPVMLLMTTRVRDSCAKPIEVPKDDDDPNKKKVPKELEEYFSPGDRIIVWLASNTQTVLSYTVAVSTMDNGIRQKFYGPLPTLNESAEKLSEDGNCLILTYFHCNYMTEFGSKSLALDVVIHSPEE